jgi:actin-related protein 3
MFQHFGNRLKRDIKQIVDRRLEAVAVASGSALRVCIHILLLNIILT